MTDRTNIIQGPKSRIDEILDDMNSVQLRTAARHGLMALAYSKASLDWNSDHRDAMQDHLDTVSPYDMDRERDTYAEDLMDKGWPDDIAHANYYRNLLGLPLLGTNGN